MSERYETETRLLTENFDASHPRAGHVISRKANLGTYQAWGIGCLEQTWCSIPNILLNYALIFMFELIAALESSGSM